MEVATISCAALSSDDVPDPFGPLVVNEDGELAPIWQFATTYWPPRSVSIDVGRFVALSGLEVWKQTGAIPEIGLDGWRLMLLWMFHEWRHGHGPRDSEWADEDSASVLFVRELVTTIRQHLINEESWWMEPEKQPSDEERWDRALRRTREAHDWAYVYELAGQVLLDAIHADGEGAAQSLSLAVSEEDPVLAARELLARRVARALVSEHSEAADPMTAARDSAYEAAAIALD